MIKETSKIVDLAVEFCRNNLDNIMVYGSLLAIFIVIISLVRVSRKRDNEDLEFDEVVYKKELAKERVLEQAEVDNSKDVSQAVGEEVEADEMKKPVENEFAEVILPALLEKIIAEEDAKDEIVKVAEAVEVTQTVEFVGVVLPPLTARVIAYEEATDEVESTGFEVEETDSKLTEELRETIDLEPLVEERVMADPVIKEPLVQPVMERNISKNTSCIEDIIEGLANLSADGVKKVEIKIHGAEVKITYGDDRTLSVVEDEGVCKEELVGEKDCYKKAETEPQSSKFTEERSVEARTYRKFGPNNNNVARSGKVYSEEELERQIID